MDVLEVQGKEDLCEYVDPVGSSFNCSDQNSPQISMNVLTGVVNFRIM